MLVRFVVKNLFSFKEQTEFNLVPGRVKRLPHHKYALPGGVEVLKLSALYGANGSGKSNLIRALWLLRLMLLKGDIPNSLSGAAFKLSEESKSLPIEAGVEFFVNGTIYFYSVAIKNARFVEEYFCEVAQQGQEDTLIFHRKEDSDIKFSNALAADVEFPTLKRIIEKDLLKPGKSLFTLLNTISNEHFKPVQDAHYWFQHRLIIIRPDTKAHGLVQEFAENEVFAAHARELLKAFATGIQDVRIEEKTIEDFLGRDNQAEIEEITNKINNEADESLAAQFINQATNEEVIAFKKDGRIVTQRLVLHHTGDEGKSVEFHLHEESDGTQRLIEYLPALTDVVLTENVYVIDEIERSIHPNIIVALVQKFSKDDQTKGQLIFSTHETNLLNQDFLRTDEIWLTEKNQQGVSTVYPLSDFKEHSTIDIQKGYLMGRYGAIPFLGDLKQVNWHNEHAEQE